MPTPNPSLPVRSRVAVLSLLAAASAPAVGQELALDPLTLAQGAIFSAQFCQAPDACQIGFTDAIVFSGSAAGPFPVFDTSPIVARANVHNAEFTATRFEITRRPRTPDEPNQWGDVNGLEASLAFAVTEAALVEFDVTDLAAPPLPAQFALSVGGQAVGALGRRVRVNVDPGERIACSFDVDLDPGTTAQGGVLRIEVLGGPACNPTDIASPFGQLDLADIDLFVSEFLAGGDLADLAFPFGQLDLADLDAFIPAFTAGCP